MPTNIMQNVKYSRGQRTQTYYKKEARVNLKVNSNSYKLNSSFITHMVFMTVLHTLFYYYLKMLLFVY